MRYNFLHHPADAVTFGISDTAELAVDKPARLYVFLLLDGSIPKTLVFNNDADGREGVSQLLRSEHVLDVVLGHRVEFEVASVTTLHLEEDYQHRVIGRTSNEEA